MSNSSGPSAAKGVSASGPATPLISVLIPEARDDLRGSAEFLLSWTRNQSVSEGVHEVIIAMKEGDTDLEASLRKNLRKQDRLIIGPFENGIVCYNAAEKIASGRFILVTENHTLAAPDCIEKLLAYLKRNGVRAASLRSDFRNSNYLDRHEEHLYRTYHEEKWSREGEWDRVRLRGFTMERSVYEEIGGLPEYYGLFAEEFLSSELARRGVKIGYAEEASIEHVNVGSFSLLRHDINEFVDGECTFRNYDYTPDHALHFGEPGVWRDRAIHLPDFRRRLAQSCGRILRSAMHEGSERQEALSKALFSRWLSLAITSFLPRKLLPEWGELAVQWHRFLAFLFQDSHGIGLDSFERMWAAVRKKRELQFLVRHSEPEDFPLPATFAFEDAEPPQIYGFHPREKYENRTLRWTGPVAAIRLVLNPVDMDVVIETGLIRGFPGEIPFGIAFNNYAIGSRSLLAGPKSNQPKYLKDGRIRFRVKREWFVEGEQFLVLCASPFLAGLGETRELGLPVLDIQFQKRGGSTSSMRKKSVPKDRRKSESLAG